MLKLVGNGGVPQQSRVEPDDDDRVYDDEEMAYTYVDHRELRGVMPPESLRVIGLVKIYLKGSTSQEIIF